MTLAQVVDQLDASLPGRVTRDASSAALTTYRCGGPFAALVRIDDDADFRRVAEVLVDTEVGVLVVGRGSNLLVADSGFDGVALALGRQFDEIEVDDRVAHVVAGGAVALPVLARRVTAAGLGGLEFFVGIPGSVGGAVCMNAGGHGRDTKDVLLHARVGSLDDGEIREVALSELELGYRRSAIGPRAVVLAATFAGYRADPAEGAARIDEIVRWRREHQPGGQNAGSVFTNPPGDAAGRLIEACGCKGLQIGGARVSEKHANFFVAEPGAAAADVYALVREVQRVVAAGTGIHLEPELHLVGFRSEVTR